MVKVVEKGKGNIMTCKRCEAAMTARTRFRLVKLRACDMVLCGLKQTMDDCHLLKG